jgi:hypothetical protein
MHDFEKFHYLSTVELFVQVILISCNVSITSGFHIRPSYIHYYLLKQFPGESTIHKFMRYCKCINVSKEAG